jgi:cellulose 1,4-beta-cellobiosidase
MPGWNYVAYVRTAGVTNVSNLDLGDVTRDAVGRGVISPSWYLIDVEAGFELWQGGAGLATAAFSFQPNGSTTTTTSPSTTSTTTAPTTTTTKPPASGATCSATYQVTKQWVNGTPPNGFTADVVVRNSGTSPINKWRVAWTWPSSGQRVTSAWRANVLQSGSTVTATNMSYNGVIEPGAAQSFGFQGQWTDSNPVPTVTCSA